MKYDIGLDEALYETLQRSTPLPPMDIEIDKAAGLVAAEDCIVSVDCPSAPVSMKDGYAVISADLKNASEDHPIKLLVTGTVFAGSQENTSVSPGTAVRIMTKAKIPQGADAVISSEFAEDDNGSVLCIRDAGVRRNILEQLLQLQDG